MYGMTQQEREEMMRVGLENAISTAAILLILTEKGIATTEDFEAAKLRLRGPMDQLAAQVREERKNESE